jgi:hypothetical protein
MAAGAGCRHGSLPHAPDATLTELLGTAICAILMVLGVASSLQNVLEPPNTYANA